MTLKVAVFVNAENINYNGGFNMRYDALRRFPARGERIMLRLNAYIAFDPERARSRCSEAYLNLADRMLTGRNRRERFSQ